MTNERETIIKTIFKDINYLRKINKNKWYTMVKTYTYQDKVLDIAVKGYNTWLQVFSINNINHSTNMDISVGRLKSDIEEAIEYHL